MADLWEYESPLTDLGIRVPGWIEQDISPADVAAILNGGCFSGAYMPAVTYHKAMATMGQYGDEVLDSLTDAGLDVPVIAAANESWAGYCCRVLSAAVEAWASSVEDRIIDALGRVPMTRQARRETPRRSND